MRRNKKTVKGISSFKNEEKPVIITPLKKSSAKIIHEDNIKTEEKAMKQSHENDMKFIKPKHADIQRIIKPKLKTLKKDFIDADDKITFLKDNVDIIKSLNNKQKKDFIIFIKNTYVE
tara:strand:+ start:652 stop:1005 length:354 start_codon:yes stop_codon:yes gene_type:complete